MVFQFALKFKNASEEKIWMAVVRSIHLGAIVRSVKEAIPYTINDIDDSFIVFSTATRNGGKPEKILKEDFVVAVSALKKQKHFDTHTAKSAFLGTKIYRKRSPSFALLKFAGVIEQVY